MDPANLQAAVEKVELAIEGVSSGFPESRSGGNAGMLDATMCGYCWMKLVPAAA